MKTGRKSEKREVNNNKKTEEKWGFLSRSTKTYTREETRENKGIQKWIWSMRRSISSKSRINRGVIFSCVVILRASRSEYGTFKTTQEWIHANPPRLPSKGSSPK